MCLLQCYGLVSCVFMKIAVNVKKKKNVICKVMVYAVNTDLTISRVIFLESFVCSDKC